jgi:short-subunit dehydrogenase
MRRQRSGHVATISSSAGFAGFEYATAYAASKFGVDGWVESLAAEAEPFGIHTTVVNPGFFRTGRSRRSRRTTPRRPSRTAPSGVRPLAMTSSGDNRVVTEHLVTHWNQDRAGPLR